MILSIAIVSLLFAGGESRPAPASIVMKREVYTRGAELTIGDVADVTGARGDEITKIPVGYAPSPGAERRLAAATIEWKLTNAGFTKDQYNISGATTVVRTQTITIPAKDACARILVELQAAAPANAIVEFPSAPTDFLIPSPKTPGTPIEWNVTKPTGTPKGDTRVTVRATAGSESLAALEVTVRYRYEKEVLVAASQLQNGESVDASRFVKKKMDITNLDGEALSDPAALVGRVLARPLGKDKVLTAQDLTLAPVYKKGDQARLIIERGSLTIEAIVRVDADGYIGARVPVTCLEFSKTVMARVLENGTLQLTGDKGK